MTIEQHEDVREPFAERHYTINELASKWSLSGEFVRQLVQHEPGVTEWVRQRPGRRRYRVFRVPSSVAERIYLRAKQKAASGSTRQVVIHPLWDLYARPSTTAGLILTADFAHCR